MTGPPLNGWGRAEEFVRHELERLDRNDREIVEGLAQVRADIIAWRQEMVADVSTLKERSRTWGAIGGALASLVVALLIALIGAALSTV